MIMPSQAHVVQPYADSQPLFARFQVESYLAGMFNPVVQLKSGGYIVIGITEALVAIDINSGRATKEGSIEDTALKTNLEAADEIARQLRLRDLAGLIVIDFIDMEERRNNAAVEKRLKDALRKDRARIQVGRISAFGLLEMSRQRLRPGMLESTTQPCPHCHGTGLIRSDDSLALAILRALEEEGTRRRSREVLVKAPVGIVNYLFNHKREHIAQIELRYGMAVRMEGDPALISPDYVIEKFKTATRVVAPVAPVVSLDATAMPELEEDDLPFPEDTSEDDVAEGEAAESVETLEDAPEDAAPAPAAPAAEGDGQNGTRKKRRRRRRRKGRDGAPGSADADGGTDDSAEDDGDDEDDDTADITPAAEASAVVEAAPEPQPVMAAEAVAPEAPAAKPRRTRTRRKADAAPEAPVAQVVAAPAVVAQAPVSEAEAPAKAPRKRTAATTTRTRKPKAGAAVAEAAAPAPVAEVLSAKTAVEALPELVPAEDPAPAAPAEAAADWPAAPAPVVEAPAADDAAKPKRKGWWSVGR